MDKVPGRGYVLGVASSKESRGRRAAEPGYSIRVASRLTAIEPDTLRMWERRYGFPVPTRTAGGSRVYSEDDVQRLLLVRRAMKVGYRPGEVVGRSAPEISQMIARSGPSIAASNEQPVSLDAVLHALTTDDATQMRAEIKNAALVLGPKRFVTDLAYPLAQRVGTLWADGELQVRHEHLVSEALSTQLRVLVSAFDDAHDGPTVVLTTLPDEAHGLGLLMMALYLGVHQVVPRLLGVNTPPDQIVAAARAMDAAAVGLSVVLPGDAARAAKQIRWIAAEVPRRVRVWVGGMSAPSLALKGDAVEIVQTWADVDRLVTALR